MDHYQQGDEALQAAIAIGESDPRGYTVRCNLWTNVMGMRLYAVGGDLEGPFATADQACRQALVADPELSSVLHDQATYNRMLAEARLRAQDQDAAATALAGSRQAAASMVAVDPDNDQAHHVLAIAYIMAAIVAQFPGSWLPENEEQVIRTAKPFFSLVNYHSGRIDYIETIHRWGDRFKKFGLKKHAYYLTLLPRYLLDKSFREHLQIVQVGSIRQSFERKILDHFRFVFELA